MATRMILETGAATLLLAATILLAGRMRLLRPAVRESRGLISFSAGLSTAYVFVHVMPALHGVRRAFAESVPMVLRFEGMAIYFLVMVGFLVFYGLEDWSARLRDSSGETEKERAFRLHVGGFAAYVLLMSYLLVNRLEKTETSVLLFAGAIAFHFLAVANELRREHGARWDRAGRFLLGGMAVLGWAIGQLFPFPQYVIALLLAFVSGAVIINSTIVELHAERNGRFRAFALGALLYGLVLLPLG